MFLCLDGFQMPPLVESAYYLLTSPVVNLFEVHDIFYERHQFAITTCHTNY